MHSFFVTGFCLPRSSSIEPNWRLAHLDFGETGDGKSLGFLTLKLEQLARSPDYAVAVVPRRGSLGSPQKIVVRSTRPLPARGISRPPSHPVRHSQLGGKIRKIHSTSTPFKADHCIGENTGDFVDATDRQAGHGHRGERHRWKPRERTALPPPRTPRKKRSGRAETRALKRPTPGSPRCVPPPSRIGNGRALGRILEYPEILEWADAFRARTCNWPSHTSGPIPEAPGETWLAVEAALTLGLRGLPGRSTIRRLIAEYRGRYHREDRHLTTQIILNWADAWHAATGKWPVAASGKIPNSADTTWCIVNLARPERPRRSFGRLYVGQTPEARARGAFYPQSRAVRRSHDPALGRRPSRRHSDWPKFTSGQIPECPDDTWKRVDEALRNGWRGLPGGSSLAHLLAVSRAVRSRPHTPSLTEQQIADWADLHRATGKWPNSRSGPIPEAVGERWHNLESALRLGGRGLPGGSSVGAASGQMAPRPK